MNVSADVIKKGRITIYSDTPENIEKSILEYNELMDKCRFEKKQLDKLSSAYIVFNPLIAATVTASMADVMFEKFALTLVILLLNAAAYVIFAFVKKNFIVSTAFTSLLILCHMVFIIVFIANVVITVMYTVILNRLKVQPGYPAFVDIVMTYERFPAPKG